jgi:hypothetical protein
MTVARAGDNPAALHRTAIVPPERGVEFCA